MNIDFQTLSPAQRYSLIIQTVVPRPIAWVLTKNPSGSHNLAPFSYFNAVCANPPMIMVSVGWRRDKSEKDTRSNILREQEFVVGIASSDLAEAMTETSIAYDPGVSEVDKADLTLVSDFAKGSLPRVGEAKISMRCRLTTFQEVGANRNAMFIAEVLEAFYDDSIVSESENGLTINADALAPLSRIGGDDYVLFGEVKTVIPSTPMVTSYSTEKE